MQLQVLVLISALFLSLSTIFTRVFMKRKGSDPVTFSAAYQIVCAFLIFGFGAIIGKAEFTSLNTVWIELLIAALLYAAGVLFMFLSLKTIEASKFSLIFSSQIFFTIIAAYFILGEQLVLYQWGGIFLLLVSVVIVSFTPDSIKFDRDEFYALMAAVFFGIGRVVDKSYVGRMNIYWFLFLGFVIPGALILLLYHNRHKVVHFVTSAKRLYELVVVSVFYSIGTFVFYLALSNGKSVQVATASIAGVVIVEILGIALLGERKNIFRKLVGTACAALGLAILLI